MDQPLGLSMKRVRLRIRGQVQGVGFRPHVYQQALNHDVSGWVMNDGEGVLLEAQGDSLEPFIKGLTDQAPPLSRIDAFETEELPCSDEVAGFRILESKTSEVLTDIPPDMGVCADCLEEMNDPDDRRFGYPFINCTHCGPRYSLTHGLPYDRAQTSMASFEMCADCRAEYENPLDRRFHAQPTCCPKCGPELSHSMDEIAGFLEAGKILAVKGLGGFHLVCDAQNEEALHTLRVRKNREAKPFAVMVQKTGDARKFCTLSLEETRLLESPERPIVLVESTPGTLPETLNPGLNRVGVMLAYTPLHHLILQAFQGRPLVMTSANPGGEPLVIDNQEAVNRLGSIADVIIEHDRDILIRVDDSVLRVDAGKPKFLRRARGYTPAPVPLKKAVPDIVGLGAFLKNTLCFTRGQNAYVSQHIGDLDTVASLDFFEETYRHLKKILKVNPTLCVHDLHPDFQTTRFAETLGLETLAVQHHHAHIASVMAEHHLEGPVLGVALDGYGYGPAGESWGGELLLVDGLSCERLGHLAPLPQPGGDKAAREPWRMGAAALFKLGRADDIKSYYQDHAGHELLTQMLAKNLNCPETTSAGRLFDAACGILRVCPHSKYEGQAPMMLESLVSTPVFQEGLWQVREGLLDLTPLLESLIGMTSKDGANLFHGTLSLALSDWIYQTAKAQDLKTVCLSGGCFLNRVLTEDVTRRLQMRGLRLYFNERVPLSDAGLSLGQVWLGAHHIKQET